jgi:hypothetical protein
VTGATGPGAARSQRKVGKETTRPTASQASSFHTSGQIAPSPWPKFVDGDVQCDDEVVETGVHEASQEVDVAKPTPTLGGLVFSVTLGHPPPNTTSVI